MLPAAVTATGAVLSGYEDSGRGEMITSALS
jgi:hypothetical protein